MYFQENTTWKLDSGGASSLSNTRLGYSLGIKIGLIFNMMKEFFTT